MSKGFKTTLMTVAIALLGLQTVAFGMAPTILNVPDIVVGDVEDVSAPNSFIFPDALDLRDFVTDDNKTPDQIVWMYTVPTPSDTRYRINGAYPVTAATVTPEAQGQINTQVFASEVNPDGDPQTITIRDQKLSPLTSSTYAEPAGTGIVGTETITLFASDGEFVSAGTDVIVYSDNGGSDRLPTDWRYVEQVDDTDFTGGNAGDFRMTAQSGSATVTTSANGISIAVGAAGENTGAWTSGDQFIPLVANSVWRVRMSVTSTQTTPGTVPLWDVVLNNQALQDPTAYNGPNGFGLDTFFLDNYGGATAATQPGASFGRTDFQVWYTPAAMNTPQFAAAFSTPSLDPYNDMIMIFRVMDSDSAGIAANLDQGTITMSDLKVDRFEYNRIVNRTGAGVTAYDQTVRQPTFSAQAATNGGTNPATTLLWNADNTLTVAPMNATTGWVDEVVNIQTGDTSFDWATGANAADDYPIVWKNNVLYRLSVDISAANQAGITNPPDIITMGMDTFANELIYMSYVSPGLAIWAPDWSSVLQHVGMPTLTASTYEAFIYSHTASYATIPNAKGMRPRMQILCDGPGGAEDKVLGGVVVNNGSIKFHRVRVNEVTVQYPGFPF